MMDDDFKLRRNYKDGEKGQIYGFLDDYVFTVESFIQLYQATFDQKWIELAKNLMDFVLLHFYDHETGMFFYTSDFDDKLILRKKEIHDNVIPSSNSEMAKNLFILGKYYYNEKYSEIAAQMLNKVKSEIKRSGIYYSNWAILLSWHIYQPFEIAFTGPDAIKKRQIFDQNYFPSAIYAGCTEPSNLPILANRFKNNSSLIYICRDKTCQKPISSTKEAIDFIKGM